MARLPTASQQRQLAALLETLEPSIANAFLDAMQRAATSVDIRALIAALDSGNIYQAAELLRINQALLFPLDEMIRGGYMAGAQLVSTTLPTAIAGGFGFDGRHPRAEAWVSERGAALVQGIVEDTQAATQAAILSGLQDGRTTRQVALDITGRLDRTTGQRTGGILGLTSEQTDYVMRARAILSSPDTMADYFKPNGEPRYKLSDRRFDGLIKKAIAAGKPLAQADIDRIMHAHKSKALKARGKLISENEAFSAQAAGRDEAYRQLLSRDDVDYITVRWQHNLSLNPRLDHVAMNGTVIRLGQAFAFTDAQMRFPHDPAGGVKHSAGCRCIAVYRVFLKRD